MSPTKSTDIDNPVDYSSMAPTEILSNNENSSGDNNNNDDDNGKNANLSQSDKEQPGQLK